MWTQERVWLISATAYIAALAAKNTVSAMVPNIINIAWDMYQSTYTTNLNTLEMPRAQISGI